MKLRTIERIINAKVNTWAKTIQNARLRKRILDGGIIVSGGAIASMLLNEEVNDYDIYFTSRELAREVAQYYVEQFNKNSSTSFTSGRPVKIYIEEHPERFKLVVKSAGIAGADPNGNYEYFEQLDSGDPSSEQFINQAVGLKWKKDSGKYEPIYMTSNAITLSDSVQLVIRFWGDAEEVHKNFDFAHCTNYWNSKTKKVVVNQTALEALLTKDLIYIGSLYPICSIIRTRKFIARGFTCTAGSYLKMVWQCQELNLWDPEVLEEQLVGVDAAYFQELIDKIKKTPEGTVIDYGYIAKLIDEIF